MTKKIMKSTCWGELASMKPKHYFLGSLKFLQSPQTLNVYSKNEKKNVSKAKNFSSQKLTKYLIKQLKPKNFNF